jgi:hypothetical protein
MESSRKNFQDSEFPPKSGSFNFCQSQLFHDPEDPVLMNSIHPLLLEEDFGIISLTTLFFDILAHSE